MIIENILDKGKIDLLTHTTDGDLLVVNAARCSFDKEKEHFDSSDEKLLHYLAREKHVLPFRHPSATLRIYAPIFVFRQLGKHQVGFSWSEVSRRYISTEPEFWIPEKIRKKAVNVKQGSSDKTILDSWIGLFEDQSRSCLINYNRLLAAGAAPEQARAILPQSMYTTCVVTGTLLGWHHMYQLRTEEHTQRETQEYAQAIGKIMSSCFPKSWEALCSY